MVSLIAPSEALGSNDTSAKTRATKLYRFMNPPCCVAAKRGHVLLKSLEPIHQGTKHYNPTQHSRELPGEDFLGEASSL